MKISDYLDRDDVARFTAKSDLQAWRLVLANWLAIAVILGVAGAYPNIITIPAALVLLAGRQLGLAVLEFEAKQGFYPGYANSNGSWIGVLVPYLGRNDISTDACAYMHQASRRFMSLFHGLSSLKVYPKEDFVVKATHVVPEIPSRQTSRKGIHKTPAQSATLTGRWWAVTEHAPL